MSRDSVTITTGQILGLMSTLAGHDEILGALCGQASFNYRREVAAIREAVTQIFHKTEVTAPSFTETLADGTVVALHPSPEKRLGEEARNAVRAIHAWADREVAAALKEGILHPGTAQAVMMIYRDAVRALDAAVAEGLTPGLTELAASARPMVPPHPEAETL